MLLSSGLISVAWARASASATSSAKSADSPAATPSDGSVLPFPPVPSASIAKPRLQDSLHKRRAQPQHLKADAPNVLIVLLDDVGFGQASTFGGEINTPPSANWPARA
jgi:arylsulfatase